MLKKILIVEDEINIAQNLLELIEFCELGNCEIARDYESAITKFNEFEPDLTILDINLLGEKTGIDVAEFIRENSDKSFIYHSANFDEVIRKKAEETEPHSILLKPVHLDVLQKTIQMALHKKIA